VHIEKFGITIDGASSEFISRNQKYIYRAPDDIDIALLSLSEPLAVSAHLISKIERALGSLKDKNILVLGAGTIGLGALMMLKHSYGAEHVDVFDICEERMSLASELGAGSPPSDLMRVKGGGAAYGDLYNAEYDIIIESTGNAQAFCSSLSLAKPLGVIGCLCMIPEAAIEQKMIVLKGLHIIGSIGGTGEFPRAIDFIKSHRDAAERIVSHKIPIDQAKEAFAIARNRAVSLKVVVELQS
jgi:L-iditol 2-dehydrogenase